LTLDRMALFILPPVALPRIWVVCFRRYGISSHLFADEIANALGTVCFVAHNNASVDIDKGQNIRGNGAVVDIPAGRQQLDRVAKRIDQSVNLLYSSLRTKHLYLDWFPLL